VVRYTNDGMDKVNIKQILCDHDDVIHSNQLVQRWRDSADEYIMVVSCNKCGRAKYIHSRHIPDWTKNVIYMIVGSICIALLVSVFN